MSNVYSTELAIRIDAIRSDLKYLADSIEKTECLDKEIVVNGILAIVSDLTQIAYEYGQHT